MDKLQQDFEQYITSEYTTAPKPSENSIIYQDMLVYYMWQGWCAAHNKYSQDNQKYIDLLKDIYYNENPPNRIDEKIEKLLGDLL